MMFLFEFGVYIRLTSQIISVSLIFGKLYLRYLKFDINSFVETSRSIKWCPGPGCQRAVRLPDVEVGNFFENIVFVFFWNLYSDFFGMAVRLPEVEVDRMSRNI